MLYVYILEDKSTHFDQCVVLAHHAAEAKIVANLEYKSKPGTWKVKKRTPADRGKHIRWCGAW